MRGSEEGAAFLAVLAVILPLFLLAAAGAFLARADLLTAAWSKRERALFYEAEGGLEKVMSQLGTPGDSPLPEEVFDPPWEDPHLPVQTGRAVTEPMSWTISPLPDRNDSDGDPSTPVVLFNRAFGYDGSPLERGGHPVFEVELAVGSGGALKTLVAEVTPLVLAGRSPAAWSISGDVVLEGPFLVSGLDHARDGSVAEDRSRDAAAFSPGVDVILLAGARRVESGAQRSLEADDAPLPTGPLDALDSGPCLEGTEYLPRPPPKGRLQGAFFAREGYRGSLAGGGVLIVHNPRFRPAAFEASRRFYEEGAVTAEFDPRYDHLDPENQPALLDVDREGVFRGLVVADAVGDVDAESGITGALVTLERSPRKVRAWAPFTILYSRDVMERAGRASLFCLLGFTSVDGPSERLLREAFER